MILEKLIPFDEYVSRFKVIATGKLPYAGFCYLIGCYDQHVQIAENDFKETGNRLFKQDYISYFSF